MIQSVRVGSTDPVYFYLVDSSTGGTPQTGKAGSTMAKIAREGSAFATGGGTIAELDATNAPGLYSYTPTSAETAAGVRKLIANFACTGCLSQPVIVELRGQDYNASGVIVATNNDKSGYSLSAGGVQAIWDALTSALTTVGSVGKLLVTNIDALISSRLATSGYTAPTTPPTAAQNAAAVWGDKTTYGAGTKGNSLAAAGSAGDPWATALPGSYGAGTAGNIVGNNLNAPVGNVPTALLDAANGVETGITLRQSHRALLAFALGNTGVNSGTGTTSFKRVSDGTTEAWNTASDANGNRSGSTKGTL